MPSPASNVVPLHAASSLLERDDDSLMLLASAGQREAFRVLVERHARRVVRFCSRMTGDARLAEEIAQETWLSVWSSRSSYEPNGQFVVWLLVAARNRCLNSRRDVARRARVLVPETTDLAETAGDDPAALDRLIAAEERRRVQRALDELPAAMREAVMLRFGETLAYEQIAEVTGTNASTVRSRVFYGVKKLHELLTGRKGDS